MQQLKSHFQLQIKLLKRHLIAFGVQPIVAILLGIPIFIGLSVALFSKSQYANIAYVFITIAILWTMTNDKRNDFLRFLYAKKDYYSLRIIENLAVALPFMLFLITKQCFYTALILFFMSVFLAFYKNKTIFHFTMPTPFFKRPFEFIIGFRVWFLAFFLAYFLTIMAIEYDNFNLGIAALMFVFLICLGFYGDHENTYFVWIHKASANGFLFQKIKTAVLFSTLLTLPIITTLLYFYPQNHLLLLGFQVVGFAYLITAILLKYAYFPSQINLLQAILFGFCFLMPPLLLLFIPFLYFKSLKKLKLILE